MRNANIDATKINGQNSPLTAAQNEVRLGLLSKPPIVENRIDGSLLVQIPQGEFLAGGEREEEGRGPFPVRLPGYYIGLHVVTNTQYANFLNVTFPNEEQLDNWIQMEGACCVRRVNDKYEAYDGKHDHPVVMVSWHGANAYCRWAGLRLPSELEWDKASRGVDGREFPWGNEWDVAKCRSHKNSCGAMTCSVWDYPAGVSPWGVSQMVGNVAEWCGDKFDSCAYQRYRRHDLVAPVSGTKRSVRGGAWVYEFPMLFRCASRHDACEPDTQSFHIGFRCALSI